MWESSSVLLCGLRLLNFSVVFDPLDQLRPPWFPVPALLVAWIAYCVATIGTATAVVLLFRGRFANE